MVQPWVAELTVEGGRARDRLLINPTDNASLLSSTGRGVNPFISILPAQQAFLLDDPRLRIDSRFRVTIPDQAFWSSPGLVDGWRLRQAAAAEAGSVRRPHYPAGLN